MKSKVVFLIFLLIILLIPVAQAEDALDWYTKGQYAIGLGNYADALTYFDNALALDKNYATGLIGKSSRIQQHGKIHRCHCFCRCGNCHQIPQTRPP